MCTWLGIWIQPSPTENSIFWRTNTSTSFANSPKPFKVFEFINLFVVSVFVRFVVSACVLCCVCMCAFLCLHVLFLVYRVAFSSGNHSCRCAHAAWQREYKGRTERVRRCLRAVPAVWCFMTCFPFLAIWCFTTPFQFLVVWCFIISFRFWFSFYFDYFNTTLIVRQLRACIDGAGQDLLGYRELPYGSIFDLNCIYYVNPSGWKDF